MGTHHWWWMRFGDHFWRRVSNLPKTQVAVEINKLCFYVIELKKTPRQHLRPTPVDDHPRIGLGKFSQRRRGRKWLTMVMIFVRGGESVLNRTPTHSYYTKPTAHRNPNGVFLLKNTLSFRFRIFLRFVTEETHPKYPPIFHWGVVWSLL